MKPNKSRHGDGFYIARIAGQGVRFAISENQV